ncbi:hypothetical protein BY996DRAFT_6559862 [Phakopsora pachyrhizi]|nr:hypothetical protein BY996DRAFT_6559862 [Phakopsora pachyrhizi]
MKREFQQAEQPVIYLNSRTGNVQGLAGQGRLVKQGRFGWAKGLAWLGLGLGRLGWANDRQGRQGRLVRQGRFGWAKRLASFGWLGLGFGLVGLWTGWAGLVLEDDDNGEEEFLLRILRLVDGVEREVIETNCEFREDLMMEEGSTRVATEPVERAAALCGDVMGRAILQGRQRKRLYGDTIAGPTKARMRFGGIKFVRRIRKPWEGKRPAGGRRVIKGMKVSVGLVRRRLEDQRRTDIGGISRTVVGRALGVGPAEGLGGGTQEVRSSYHFRVRTKVNSTSGRASGGRGTTAKGGGVLQELVTVGGLGLEYPGKKKRVERFIERYEAAGDNKDAEGADLARQINNFVTDEEDAMDIEDLLGYRSQDWETLKREMISCWGGKDMRHKIGDLERLSFQEYWSKFEQTWFGLSSRRQRTCYTGAFRRIWLTWWCTGWMQQGRYSGLNLIREAAYKELELRGMRKRPNKKREAVAEDFAAKLRSQESMEGELIKQLAEVRVEMAALKANKVAAGPPRVYSGPMECFYCGRGHPKTVCPVLAADTESGKVRSVGREYYLKDGRKVEAAAVARMVGMGKGMEVSLGLTGDVGGPGGKYGDRKPAEFQEESAQQKECRRVAAKAMEAVNGGVTLSMRELITVSPMIAREAARMIREFGRPTVNKGELGQEEGKLLTFAAEGRGVLVDLGSMINIMPKSEAWIIPILGIGGHKTKVFGIMAGVGVTVGGVVRELSFIVTDIPKAVLGRPFLYAFQAGLEYSAQGDELMRITDEDGRGVVIGICDKESGDWPETPDKLEKLAGLTQDF